MYLCVYVVKIVFRDALIIKHWLTMERRKEKSTEKSHLKIFD